MSSFRVGQRVRIVNDDCLPNLYNGREATIMEISHDGWHDADTDEQHDGTVYSLSVDGFDYDEDEAWEAHEITPIQDDGRKVVSWNECLWQPHKETV